MNGLTGREVRAYKLLFEDGLSAVDASKRLAEEGVVWSPQSLADFKVTAQRKLEIEARREHALDNMLDSYDKAKIEFEDVVRDLKEILEEAKARGDTGTRLAVNMQLMNGINTALRVLGKIAPKMGMNVNTQNVNIVSSYDFMEAFKKNLYSWFEDMEVEERGTELVFKKPSAELLGDFHRWTVSKMKRKAVTVTQGGDGFKE